MKKYENVILGCAVVLLAGGLLAGCSGAGVAPGAPPSVKNTYLAVADEYGAVDMFTVGTGGALSGGKAYSTTLASGATSSAPHSVAFSPNGDYAAVADYYDSTVDMFTVGSGGMLSGGKAYSTPVDFGPVSSEPYSVAFSPNGDYVAVADYQDAVDMFTVGSGGTLGPGKARLPPLASGETTTQPDSVAFGD